jgi:hypothetical protein
MLQGLNDLHAQLNKPRNIIRGEKLYILRINSAICFIGDSVYLNGLTIYTSNY